jgi:hypothetical protein
MKLNYCIRHHHEIREQCWTKCVLLFLPVAVYGLHISFPIQYIQLLGDTMNIPLCWQLTVNLSAMCLDSFSDITVKYVFQHLTATACYIPQTVSVLTSFFTSTQNRNIESKNTYHYNRDATESLRGKLWICNTICISIINTGSLLLQLGICSSQKFFLVHDFSLISGGTQQTFS